MSSPADRREVPPLPPIERLQELMFDAARMGRDDVIPALLGAGVDIEARDAKGYTALILASYNGHASATVLLLDHGAMVDGADNGRGNTPLMGVAFKGYAEIAAMLIAAGAEVDRRNRSGQTALMNAALFDKTDIVDMLLAAGADRDAADDAGNSPRSVSAAQSNIPMMRRLSA